MSPPSFSHSCSNQTRARWCQTVVPVAPKWSGQPRLPAEVSSGTVSLYTGRHFLLPAVSSLSRLSRAGWLSEIDNDMDMPIVPCFPPSAVRALCQLHCTVQGGLRVHPEFSSPFLHLPSGGPSSWKLKFTAAYIIIC